jgi:hypothetical protein
VILTHNVADHAGALVPTPVRPVAAVVHGIEDSAVHRLEPVTDLRQRTSHDHAHGVIEVGLLDLVLQVDRLAPVGDRLQRDVTHELAVLLFVLFARARPSGTELSPYSQPSSEKSLS